MMALIIKADPLINVRMALGNWHGIPWPDDPVETMLVEETTGRVVVEHIDDNLKFFVPPHNGEYFHAWLED